MESVEVLPYLREYFSVTSGGFTAFERGCTEVTDESKYTCQQVVEGEYN